VSDGTEHIVWDGGIVLLSCLMKPNYPPIEHTEERFHTFNPLLEVHPRGCEDLEVTVIKNTNKRDWGPWKDYPPREKKRLLHLAEENRASLFTKGFGEPEPLQALSYVQPEVWIPQVFEQNKVVHSEGTSGYKCKLCDFYADKTTMLEHVRDAEHLQKASKSPDGIWADPSQGPIAVPSGTASGSSASQSWPSWAEIAAAELNVVREKTWDEGHPWGNLTGARSSAHSSVTPTRQQEKPWQPTTVESGEVQKLTDLPGATRLPIMPAEDAPLSIIEMALRFPDQGLVIRG